VHEYYQVNNMHPPNLIRITAWWTVEPQNWQSSDPDTPNQIGNLQNFKNDDLGNNGDDNSQNNRRGTSSSSGEGCTPLTGEIVSFTLELKEGYNYISLPFTVIGVDHCESALEEISDLFLRNTTRCQLRIFRWIRRVQIHIKWRRQSRTGPEFRFCHCHDKRKNRRTPRTKT
jgi:hypothetical protein